MVSPSAWEGLDAIAKELGYKSRSDLIEAVERREVKLEKPDEARRSTEFEIDPQN